MFRKPGPAVPLRPIPALVTETLVPELAHSPKRPCCLQREFCLQEDSACTVEVPVWPDSPLAFPQPLCSQAGLFPQISVWLVGRVYWYYSGLWWVCHLEGSAATPAPPVSPQSSVSFSCFSPVHFSVCFLSPALECELQHSRNLSRPMPHPGLAGPHFGLVSSKPITGSICLEANSVTH